MWTVTSGTLHIPIHSIKVNEIKVEWVSEWMNARATTDTHHQQNAGKWNGMQDNEIA